MKKNLLAIALLALATFSTASIAKPKEDHTIVRVYGGDIIRGPGSDLVRVETVASLRSVNHVKLYVRYEDIPAHFFEDSADTKNASTDKPTTSDAGGQSK